MGMVGKTERRRRLRRLVVTAATLCIGIALLPLTAGAVHDEGLFELDAAANYADDAATPGQDWSSFQAAAGAGVTSPIATVRVNDVTNSENDDIFTGGGSQNNNDISSWAWKCAGSPSTKSDIEHAFASAYILNNELFLYFGVDRYDPTGGTTTYGFWFLQNGGALDGGSGCPDANPAANTFTGQHAPGDLFVFAELHGGGGDAVISVYRWNTSAPQNLELLFTKSAASFCNAADTICGRMNTGTVQAPWPYFDNQGSTGNNVLPGGFFEGGVNLSQILGNDLPCINRFLAVSSSSGPTVGVLEDFAGGGFNLCSTLRVDKVTDPAGDTTQFPFSATGPDSFSQTFSLADGDPVKEFKDITRGEYFVNETPGSATIWNAPIVSCKDQNDNTVTYDTSDGSLNIGPGQTVTCTFTNVKRTGTIKVVKDFQGTPTSVGLQVDGTTKTTVTADGETSLQTVTAGTSHTAGEVFTTAGDAANYTSSFACTRNGSALSSGSALTTPSFTVNGGDAIVCTYTNVRNQGKIELKKDFVGTPDSVTLNIGS
jgi:hypothetical protein